MMKFSLKYTPQDNNPYSIDDASSVTIDLGEEIKNDSMRVKLKNFELGTLSDGTIQHNWVNKDGQIIFQPVRTSKKMAMNEELIDCYCTWTESNPLLDVESDSYLLFNGVINKGQIKYNEQENSIELTCLNRTSIMLDRLTIPGDYSIMSTPEIIQKVVRAMSDQQLFKAYDDQGLFGPFKPYHVDARLFTEGIKASGTSTSVATNELNDTSASFAGSLGLTAYNGQYWVRNTSTNAYAYVTAVSSTTKLTLSKNIFTASGQGYQVSDGFIQDKRPDGTDFPDTTYSVYMKPCNETFTVLSSYLYTNSQTELNDTENQLPVQLSGKYFVDKKARFHWYIPSDTPDYYFEVGQTAAISPDSIRHRIHNVDLNNEVRGLVNFIIFEAGTDMNNLKISGYQRAPFSGIPNAKQCLLKWPSIADGNEGMKAQDARAGNITQDQGTRFNYPSGSAYPFSPAWNTGITVTSNSEYNEEFIAEAKRRGQARAFLRLQKLANPRWAGKIQIRGEPINVGDLIHFTSKEHGIKNILVRVKQVTHSITPEQGWITSLDVIEDENRLLKGVI